MTIDTNKAREYAQRLQHGRLVATNGPHVINTELATLLLALADAHDRMAKALEHLVERADTSDDCCYGTLSTSYVRDIAAEALKEAAMGADQRGKDG